MNPFFRIVVFLFCVLHAGDLFAQGCCTVSSSSLRGLEGGVWGQKKLNVGANYQFNSLTQAYQGTDRVGDTLRRAADVGYFTLYAEYGLVPRLSIFASMNFNDKSREITVTNANTSFTETVTFRSSGFGDILLLAKYEAIPLSIISPFGLAIGGGTSLPTGSFTKERGGVQLSPDLQPGTGAVALLGWMYATRFFTEDGVQLMATATYRYSGVNLDGYRIGDEVLLLIGAEYSWSDHFGLFLQLRSRFAMQDYANRRVLSSTGGTYHDILPSVTYRDGASFFRVFGQLPLYRNVRGLQLTVSYLLGVEYGYTFDFSDPFSQASE